MFDLWRDVRFAARRLARTPTFTLATVVTLALGIGANTAIFSVVDGVLLRPLPYREPDRLVGLWQTAPGVNIKDVNASLADYLTYRDSSQTLEDAAIWNSTSVTVTGVAEPERVDAITSTFRLLPMLGVQPALGRAFVERDDEVASPEVVMLGHGYWQRRFGSNPAVVGQRITVDGTGREIIGVLPKGFWFMDEGVDLVVPLRFDRTQVRLAGYNFQGLGRLRPGVSLQQANADVARMIAIELGRFPPPEGMSLKMMDDARLGPNVRPLIDDLLGDVANSLWVIMATIGIVLLIACANVANLLLVRTEGRAQELAVRAALGAGRGRLAREMLVESLLLGLLGGTAGVGLAVGALKVVLGMNTARLPRLEQTSVDGRALLFTLVISIVAGLAFGAIPILKRGRIRLAEALRAGGRNTSAGRDRNLARNLLTVTQVSLALILLVGAGLMIRTFQSLRHVQPGFSEPASLQTLRIAIARDTTADAASLRVMQQTLVSRFASLPGVSAVSLMDGLPMTGFSSQDPIFASDHSYGANQIPPLRRFIRVAPGTFQALGTPLRAGRDLSWTDLQQERAVALISENFAREYWGSPESAVGKQIRENPNDKWSEVIGVVGDIRHDGVDRPAPATVYWPQRTSRSMTFMLRTARAGTESLATEVRQVVREVSPSLPVTQTRTMAQVYDRSMARTSFTLTLLAISGGMALLLAAIGIYAVISYTVAQRTREIGIRLALGAREDRLTLMFVRRGLTWAGIGAVLGLTAAAALSQLISSLLFEINPIDPLTYATVLVALLAAAALASYVPARRVTRIDPVEALRAE